MNTRVPAPDGRKVQDGRPLLVLKDGTVLNDCYQVSFLTVGGMSIAYKGIRDGASYFIKEVNTGDLQQVLSLSQEKSMIERLNHPGIVKCHDFFERDGFCYLVMEYVEGTSLDKVIPSSGGSCLEESIVLDWAHQLYDVFEYLHSQKPQIIYRDLKPANLILDRHGRIHLVDFGIARVYKGHRSEDTMSMGSAITASPEHYGGGQTDERSDIYTIGATLNFLLTSGRGKGLSYFDFVPVREINPAVSRDFDRIIMKALEVEPEKRFQTVREMRDAHRHPAILEASPPTKDLFRPESADLMTTRALNTGARLKKKGLPVFAIPLTIFIMLLIFLIAGYFLNQGQFKNPGESDAGDITFEGGCINYYNGRITMKVPDGFVVDPQITKNFNVDDKMGLYRKRSNSDFCILQFFILNRIQSFKSLKAAADSHVKMMKKQDRSVNIISRTLKKINDIEYQEFIFTLQKEIPFVASREKHDLTCVQLLFFTGHKKDVCLITIIVPTGRFEESKNEIDHMVRSLKLSGTGSR